jgi:hypothetical protein
MRRIILFFLALPAFSQALVDHAAAAAGASIGATAGKPLSNGITAVFGKVDDTTAQAAKKPAEKDKDKADKSKPEKPSALGSAPSASASGSSIPSSRPQRASSPRPSSRRAAQPNAWPEPVVYTQVPAPAAKEPALQDLLNVQIGSKEQDCIAGLGTPSSRISIPEEGHMIELLRYTAQGRLLGTIRVDNGQVVNVLAANIAR